MKTTLIYCRVSTNEQDVSAQIKELTSFGKGLGYDKFKEFKDEGISGAVEAFNRKGFGEMIDYIKKNRNNINLILVYSLDRIGRDSVDILKVMRYFVDEKINVVILKDFIKLLDDNGEKNYNTTLMLNILAAVAEIERAKLKSRFATGKLSSIVDGFVGVTSHAYGYNVEGEDKRHKKLVVNENEAVWVRWMYEQYIAGKGTSNIAQYLNNKGIKSKFNKKWQSSTITNLLSNKLYAGYRTFKGKEYNNIPAIVDLETYNKAYELIKSKKYVTGQKQKHANLNLLKGLIYCEKCGNPLYFYHVNNTVAYKCSGTLVNKKIGMFKTCDCSAIDVNKLNSSIYHIFENTDMLKEIINNKAINKDEYLNRINSLKESIKENNKEIEILNKKKAKYYDIFGDNNQFDKVELTRVLKNVEENIKKLNDKNILLNDEIKDINKMLNDTDVFKEKIIELKENPILFKDLLSDLIENIKIKDVERMPDIHTHGKDKAISVLLTLKNKMKINYVISQRTWLLYFNENDTRMKILDIKGMKKAGVNNVRINEYKPINLKKGLN